MKALVYAQPGQMELQERPMPELVDGEVVLKIEAVGICGSDLHAWHGHDPRRQPGLVFGHEFVGRIERSAAPGFEPGSRWTGNPLIVCGTCAYCVQGRNNLCANRTMVGMTRAGGFAERMSIPVGNLIDLPADMDPVQAALTEPAATALHAVHMAMRALHRPLQECTVLILGGGAVGLLAALLLGAYGVRGVQLAETNALRRDSARSTGSCDPFDPASQSGPAEASCDLVIDAVGAKSTRTAALRAVRPGGVIVHVGLQDWASEIDMRKLTLAEIALIGTYTYTTADLRATVKAIHGGVFGDLTWVEERPLAAGAAAFADLDQGRSAAAKIVLRPH